MQSQTIITYCNSETKIRSWSPRVIIFLTFLLTGESVSLWLLGCCCHQLCRSSLDASMVYSLAECVFILKYYFTLKSFAAVLEALSSAYPGKEVLNETIILMWPVSLCILFSSGLRFKWYFLCITCFSFKKLRFAHRTYLWVSYDKQLMFSYKELNYYFS
jgi:hypothetical protein